MQSWGEVMKSEFEKLLKQHRDDLTDELVKLGNYRQVQLVEWDIERNETDYEFYFDGAWNAQQSKVDELQKRVDAVKGLAQTLWEKSEEKHQQGKVWESKTLGECADEILDVLEQALKGEQP